MYKSVKINIQFFAAFFMVLGMGTISLAMEKGTQEKVTLVSSDDRSFTVDRSIAEQSVTIKHVLEALRGMGVEGGDLDIPLSKVDAASLQTIIGILERAKNIAPRKIDGKRSPYKFKSVVDSFLGGAAGGGAGGGAGGASFDEVLAIMLAVNYLDIPFLIDAVAFSLVDKDRAQVRNIVLAKDFDIIPAELHLYLQKHLNIVMVPIVFNAYSVADFIEEQPEQIKLDDEGRLRLNNLGITDLYGLEYIKPEIKSKITKLDLSFNSLTSVPKNVFQELNNLQVLNLSVNQLKSIPANAFQRLNNLRELILAYNDLTSLPADAFKGLVALKRLSLFGNPLASIPANVFQGLDNLRELILGNNKLNVEQKKDIGDSFRSKPDVKVSF